MQEYLNSGIQPFTENVILQFFCVKFPHDLAKYTTDWNSVFMNLT